MDSIKTLKTSCIESLSSVAIRFFDVEKAIFEKELFDKYEFCTVTQNELFEIVIEEIAMILGEDPEVIDDNVQDLIGKFLIL